MRPYDLGEPAADIYQRLSAARTSPLTTARELAELTIPSEFPPEGYTTGDKIGSNNQSIGSIAVNTLAALLMFMAFPPGRPMMRFKPVEHKLADEIKRDPTLWSKVKLGLARKEIEHRERAETTPLRSTYTAHLRQLLIGGNSLWQHVSLDHPTVHRMDTYVVKRDAKGQPLFSILLEEVSLAGMEEDHRDILRDRLGDKLKGKAEWEQTAKVYTVCKLDTEGDERVWRYWQEAEGELLPGTEVTADFDNPPMYPDWLIPVFGQDWGRSYCEQYRGDLFTVETASSSLNDGAALAALCLLFVKPGGRTSVKQIKMAENLAVLSGSAEDVTAFRLDKNGDFQFVSAHLDQAYRRLSRAFLLQTSIVRDAERVTREEIARLGNELEKAMGGLYSELSQRTQRTVVLRFVRLHEEDDEQLPQVPEGLIRLSVVTGIDALGATTEEDALVTLGGTINTVFGPGSAGKIMDPSDFTRRLAAEKGIQPEGLIKTAEALADERDQERQMVQQQTLLDKAAGPIAGEVAKSLGGQLQAPPETPQE
ncbi:MAG: portal protein [Pseudomonadota bacterium]